LPPNSEVVRNQAKFCMFLAPIFLGGGLPEIVERHYKTRPITDHRAKFHAHRQRDLGDLALKIKLAKHKQPKSLGQSPT